MKKVVHLARKFLPPTASFIFNQIIHHKKFEPSIVYCEPVFSAFSAQLEKSYPTYSTINNNYEQWWYRYTRRLTVSAQSKLVAQLKATDPDIFHVHYGVDALVYAHIYGLLNQPVLVSFYGYDCTSFPNRFWGLGRQWLQRSLFNNPHVSAYTAMSPDMKDDLVNLGCPSDKIIVHYHGSDPQPFFYKRKYQDNSEVRLLIISSLTSKKGHRFLLDAFRQAQARSVKQLHLHIVGDGELKAELEEYIKEHALDQVYLHGPIVYGSDQHHRFLRQADIFVHPSVTTSQGEKEGIPGALIEARSSGLPVITTWHAGIPYIVEHKKNGWLVPEYDTEKLAQAIVQLAESATQRAEVGRAGQQYTLDQLDIRKKEEDLERIYQELIRDHSGKKP